jgi:hypothetical protein
MLIRCLTMMAGVIAMSISLTAECVVLGDIRRYTELASYVFEGTVVSVERVSDGYPGSHSATIEVTRVWKGNVSRHFTVYFQVSIDFPVLEVGSRSS